MRSQHANGGVLSSLTGWYRGPAPRPVASHHRLHKARRFASLRERTAFHEAGHVAFWVVVLDSTIYKVTVVPNKWAAGRVFPGPVSNENGPCEYPITGTTSHLIARLEARMALSGLAAEAVWKRSRAMWLAPEFDQARRCIAAAFDRVSAPSVFHDCWLEQCRRFEQPALWAGITALARELLEHGELDGDRAKQIVHEAMNFTNNNQL